MKFAHMADCHIGSWRDPKMKNLSTEAFKKAAEEIMEKKAEFLLISGDLFNTATPSIDQLKETVRELKRLNEKGIKIYAIEGSHDFSPSGKTMIKVLDEAGLLINVAKIDEEKSSGEKLAIKFTEDKKTGAKITGIIGRANQLDKEYYKLLDRELLEKEEGFKIFMFHNSITELKTKEFEKMESESVTILPEGFDYYAGGHIHIINKQDFNGRKNVVYPGPLFPANFKELEELKNGGYYFYEDGKAEYSPVTVKNVLALKIDAEGMAPEEVEEEALKKIEKNSLNETIVLLRIEGNLKTGKPSDINFKKIFQKAYDKSAYFVMKNTAKLNEKDFQEIHISANTPGEIEEQIINENAEGEEGGIFKTKDNEKSMMKQLIHALNIEKQESEKKEMFEKRVKETAEELFKEIL